MNREPLGTTRRGQFALGLAGLLFGVGGGVGLVLAPKIFEPLVIGALSLLNGLTNGSLYYLPTDRPFLAVALSLFGLLWCGLLAYALLGQPARDRDIDHNLKQRILIDKAQRSAGQPEGGSGE